MTTILLIFFVAAIIFSLLSGRDRSVLFATSKTITVNNQKRFYLESNAVKKSDHPKIVIGLHGYGDSARRFAYYTALHNAVGSDTIVVYPNAVKPKIKNQKPGWNSGFCCGSGWKTNTDDVEFLTQLIKKISKENGVSAESVYVAGYSNGSFMAQRLATDRPKLVTAVAAVSGSIGTSEKSLEPKTPTPILLMHGKKDKSVPFNGGSGSDPDFGWLPFATTLSTWQNVNGQQAKTKSIIYAENGHKWDDWRIFNFWHKRPRASVEVVNFFESVN